MDQFKLTLEGTDSFLVQEAYKVLRTNLQFCGQDVKVIEITSCHENEGKTTISLNIAKSFADLGKKVLLIDADMRKSVMAGRNLNAKDKMGLSEVLTGLAEVNDCIFKTSCPNLFVMLSGSYPPNPVELLDGKYFSSLVEGARKSFDYVIIDTPPLGAVIDAAVIATNCDGAVVVVGSHRLSYRMAQEVVEQLKKSNCRVLGAIRNNVRLGKKNSYYYKSKYYYSSDTDKKQKQK